MDYPITIQSAQEVAGTLGGLAKEIGKATFQKSMYINSSDGLTTLNLDLMQSFAFVLCIYYFGVFLKKKIEILNRFCIPAPVVGGLLFAILNLVMRQNMGFAFGIDTTFQKPFMMVFFTTIGMTASLQLIKKGGIGLVIFLAIASVLCAAQDLVGVLVAKTTGASPLLGLICGSVTMTGGHGTGAAFAGTFSEMGVEGAKEVAMAAATFGLITGSLMGGPLGASLIRRHKLESKAADYSSEQINMEAEHDVIDYDQIFKAMTQLVVAVALGAVLSIPIKKAGITLPAYVTSMIIAAIMLNVGESTGGWHVNQKAVGLLGTLSLNAFLSFALCGLKLWQLADVAGPMVAILGAQAVLMFVFAYFVTFNVMGRDFDAATLAGGHCGFGMGATANGVANMTSIQEAFGPAPRAFFILPVVGAFLIDFSNAAIITFFVNMVK